MIDPDRLQKLLLDYAEEAKLFFYSYGLANLVVDVPIDHVAVKALNTEVYKQYLDLYKPLCKRLSEEQVGPRFIAIAELNERLDAGNFGAVSTLEIMEPKPDAIATTHDLIDHIEILVEDLENIKQGLQSKDVLFKEQKNENHSAIVIEINEWGQEIKFSNRSLANIAEKQLANGVAKLVS